MVADGDEAADATATADKFPLGDGLDTNNFQFAADKYPSLRSYKEEANAQVEGDLLPNQPTDFIQP